MSVQSTSKWGFTYHRAFEDVDTKMHTKNPKSNETGFRYYVKADLQKESQKSLWKSFKAAVLMLIGKSIKIDGKDCIIGRRSFKEFITRVDSKAPEFKNLKTLDMQTCINKLVAFQKKPTHVEVVKEPSTPTKQVEKQAEKLADEIRKSPAIQRSPSMQKLVQEIVEFGHHPDDQHADMVERALELVEEREPEVLEHMEFRQESSSSPSREVRAESTSREAEASKSEKEHAMDRINGWDAKFNPQGAKKGIDWGTKRNLQRTLNTILQSLPRGEREQFEKDIAHWKFHVNGNKVVQVR